jgi:hypothetical protein
LLRVRNRGFWRAGLAWWERFEIGSYDRAPIGADARSVSMVLSFSVAALVTLSRALGRPGPMILFRRVPRSDRLRPISNHSTSKQKEFYDQEVVKES